MYIVKLVYRTIAYPNPLIIKKIYYPREPKYYLANYNCYIEQLLTKTVEACNPTASTAINVLYLFLLAAD